MGDVQHPFEMEDRRPGSRSHAAKLSHFRLSKDAASQEQQNVDTTTAALIIVRQVFVPHLAPFKSPSQVKNVCFHRLGFDSACHSVPSRLSSLLEISSPLSVKPSNSESPSSDLDGRIRNALRHVIRLPVSYVPMSLPI